MKGKILIVTALGLELEAVKAFLTSIGLLRHPSTGSIYDNGYYIQGNQTYDILLIETGAGNVRAAEETTRAIEFFKPNHVFFVGIAGGIKDVKLGDVVIGSKVIGYEMGKNEETFKPRHDTIPTSYQLEQIAKYVRRESSWQERAKVVNPAVPVAFVQPIAAGEKVIASNRTDAFKYLRQYCSDAVAVEMEGNGFLVAARAHQSDAIVIRGISDLIENKDQADASGYQPIAAANAAAFAFAMIDSLNAGTTKQDVELESLDFKKRVTDGLVNFYPAGPEEAGVWKRAGGDVSILNNAQSRRSQWFNAVEKLLQGGGGKNISLDSLAAIIKEDYPKGDLSFFQPD